LEKINKSLTWTQRALKDLENIKEFNSELLGNDKALEITYQILTKVDMLESHTFDYSKIGAVDESFSHLKNTYRKLIEGYYKITYREGVAKIYITRIFDLRRNPNKNK